MGEMFMPFVTSNMANSQELG